MEPQPSAQSPFQKLSFSVIKKHATVEIKNFWSCPILLDFFLLFQIHYRLVDFNIDSNTIIKLILSLEQNKTDGCSGFPICIISKLIQILFNNNVKNECFPNEWKKANITTVYKKADKQIIKSYRPVSLLSKFLKTNIFNSLLKYLENNKFPAFHQSDFQPGGSCLHQLL